MADSKEGQLLDFKCINCSAERGRCFLDLGLQPNGNTFPKPGALANEQVFPLRMGVCEECWQVQLLDQVDPAVLYSDHPYVTGANAPMVTYFKAFAQELVDRYELNSEDTVLDIGCNDGTLLTAFKKEGVRTYGVEPSADLCHQASRTGHSIMNAFWGDRTGAQFAAKKTRPSLITATAVFYHVADLHDFLRGVCQALRPGGVFVVQAVSLLSLVQGLQFDHFYHEHTSIHSLQSLRELLKPHGLHVFDIENNNIQGGSFVAHIGRVNEHLNVSQAVGAQLQAERRAGLDDIETYISFGRRVHDIAENLKDFLKGLRSQGATVHGMGAPVKSATILNFANIGSDLVQALEEVNPKKLGKLSPGRHIPVVPESALDDAPDYYVVFAWNYLDFLIEKKRPYLENGGRFILYLPELRVIDANAL